MAGLPGISAWVAVGPPLSRSGPRPGLPMSKPGHVSLFDRLLTTVKLLKDLNNYHRC